MHLHNYIPITRKDTRRRSNARMPQQSSRAYQSSDIRRAEKVGQERVWCMADLKQKGVRAVYCPDKKEKPLNCCSSLAARRASENADAICNKSNRGTSETQVLFL